ncbi:MAG: hypothetical protein K2X87_00240 [Gemmataceae bacterium]|nr:hypothetical protein [Gemmataceae bacterium]
MRTPARRPGLLAAAVLGLLAGPAPGQNAVPDDGLFVTVRSPITSEVVSGIKSQVSPRLGNPARPVRAVVFDFTPGGKDATNADFAACYGLADFIGSLKASTTTVAFVHAKATGHTVLPVLACKELVMGRGAALGEVLTDGVPAPTKEKAGIYRDVAEDRKGLFPVVQKMWDKDLDLGRGLSAEDRRSVVYVDRRPPKDAPAKVATNVEPVPGGEPGRVALYPADQAVKLGLAKALADARPEVAELYNLRSSEDDPLGGRSPDAYRYTLSGEVDNAMREAVGRILKDIKKKKGNVLVLTLDCGGGDLEAARRLADDLLEARTGDDPVKVIGFIPEGAPAAAAVVALGCSELVMSKRLDAREDDRGEATLGDFAGYIEGNKKNPGAVDANRKSLKELAEGRGLPGLLIDGLFDRDLEVVQAKAARSPARRLMTQAEVDASNGEWVTVRQVKPKGQYLKLTASLAEELGVARHAVDTRDPAAVYALYGLDPGRVKEVTPGWLDRFAEFLRQPGVAVLLVMIGFVGLILELKVPGLTVPGIVAALAFILVFWSQSRFSGEMFALALLVFLLGLVLVGLEIFVLPGFGAPGIFGVLCMLAGLGLVTFERVPETAAEWGALGVRVTQYMLGMIGAFALAFGIARFLPKVPYANRLLLAPPDDPSPAEGGLFGAAAAAAGLLGAIGTANTPLRPAGVARFGDEFRDVLSDGGFIPAGARVQVIAVEGPKIVVKEV